MEGRKKRCLRRAQIKAFQPIRAQTVSYNVICLQNFSHISSKTGKKTSIGWLSQCNALTSLAAADDVGDNSNMGAPCEMCKVSRGICVCASKQSQRPAPDLVCFPFIPASVAGCHRPVSFNTLHLLGWIWYLKIMDWSSKRRLWTGNFSRGHISQAICTDATTHNLANTRIHRSQTKKYVHKPVHTHTVL